jgi:steroid delta-isomerase-like uncharacterized protein
MSTSQEANNKAIFIRFQEALNSGDPALISSTIDELVMPDAAFHAPTPTDATGAQAIKQVWAALLRAFPDIHVAIEDVIAEGDRVVLRNTVTGTQLGEYRGMPPSGRTVVYNEIFIVRIADGRIAEIWGVVDALSQLRQLGAIPV